MKIPILDLEKTYEEILEEFQQEIRGIQQAINNNNKVTIIEESLEVIQTGINLLDKLNIEGFDIRQAIMRHEKKVILKRNNPYRGWIQLEVVKR